MSNLHRVGCDYWKGGECSCKDSVLNALNGPDIEETCQELDADITALDASLETTRRWLRECEDSNRKLNAMQNEVISELAGQRAEIERLRKERDDILAAKEIVFQPPAIPEGFVIQELQKTNVALHADIARLRSGVRCPHCANSNAEIERLRELLREALLGPSQFPDWFIRRVREALGE